MIIQGATITGGFITDVPQLYEFSTYTFTTAGITGRTGPTLVNCQTAYAGQPWLTDYFSMTTQGYQRWTVPATGSYQVTVAGSRGGRVTGQTYTSGLGAIVKGTVQLTAGDVLEIICGQFLDTTNTGAISNYYGLGGGGGSFLNNTTTSSLLFAAGGGGGASFYQPSNPQGYNGGNGQTTTAGGTGGVAGSNVGGTAGSGGLIYTQTNQYKGGAGGGWLGNGKNGDNTSLPTGPGATYGGGGAGYSGGFIGGTYGNSWSNPSTYASTYGGFGGGGGGNGIICGGAGGGYSGGGISGAGTTIYLAGAGGGGSYIISSASGISTSDGNYESSSTFNGSAITNLGAYNTGSGYVTITKV